MFAFKAGEKQSDPFNLKCFFPEDNHVKSIQEQIFISNLAHNGILFQSRYP